MIFKKDLWEKGFSNIEILFLLNKFVTPIILRLLMSFKNNKFVMYLLLAQSCIYKTLYAAYAYDE